MFEFKDRCCGVQGGRCGCQGTRCRANGVGHRAAVVDCNEFSV